HSIPPPYKKLKKRIFRKKFLKFLKFGAMFSYVCDKSVLSCLWHSDVWHWGVVGRCGVWWVA
ncbi:hypothetical protein, partial [uncultured Helicobacter sp.]|uniref:hypothetical protein n=1 Tax=uncultured Helicobacter sp. TaxID=175537 RepID=UPI00375069E2